MADNFSIGSEFRSVSDPGSIIRIRYISIDSRSGETLITVELNTNRDVVTMASQTFVKWLVKNGWELFYSRPETVELFQTPTSRKNNVWHVLQYEDDHCAFPLCGVGGYYFGGYHRDKPDMTKENMARENWDGSQNLCPSCVLQAYKDNKLVVEFK